MELKTCRAALAAALLFAVGCGGGKTLRLPDEMRRPEGAAASARGEAAQASAARPAEATRAVVRMAEHGRTWEVELPDGAGPYELRIPLSGKPAAEEPTLADRELARPPPATAAAAAAAAAPKRSYLATVAKIRELFAARRHELALIELGNAEADFPDDARLWAMKGTLYLQLGKRRLARSAWQKALQLGPDEGVQQALRELGGEE